MTGKKWVTLFVTCVICVVLFIGGMNYFVDPFGYFKGLQGEYFVYQDSAVTYSRHIKAQYIKKHGKEYDAFLIGGSKAGAIYAEKLLELDGDKYYNTYIPSGNFQIYLDYTNYILKNCKPKKILLHISGPEVKGYDRQYLGDVYKIPAEILGKGTLVEMVQFLMKNVEISFEKLTTEKNLRYAVTEKGERTLNYYEELREKNPKAYEKKHVTYDYDKSIKKFLMKKRELPAIDENLKALEQMKDNCDKNGVELMVIFGPTFTAERYEFENYDYFMYMDDIIDIVGEAWDFSGDCPINRNPSNFYNESHYNCATANRMIDIIKENAENEDFLAKDGFGQHVTQKSKSDFIERRKELYENMKKEYEETGTLSLGSYNDKSHIK